MYSCSYQGYKRKWNESEPRSGRDANSGTHSQVSLAEIYIFWMQWSSCPCKETNTHEVVRLIAYFTCTSHPGKRQHLLRSSLLIQKYLLSAYYVLRAGDAVVHLIKSLSLCSLHSGWEDRIQTDNIISDNNMLPGKKRQWVSTESDLMRVMMSGTTLALEDSLR